MAPKNKNAAAAAARTASPAPAVASSSSLSSPSSAAAATTTTSTPAQQVSAVTSVPSVSSSLSNKPSSSSSSSSSSKAAANQSWDKVIQNLTKHYLDTTPQRTKLIDAFQVFLVTVGALQFLYCILAGNYPFNAFLSGFSATVGQFVLTASLRIQTTESNKKEFPAVSPERAFADYVVCSLILHFFCVNFIN